MSTDGGLRPLFRSHLPLARGWLWTPLETGGTTAGVPDSHYACVPARRSGWLEFKQTTGWAIKFRPHQTPWLLQHAAAGERVTIAIRATGKGSSDGRGDSLWLFPGTVVRVLACDGLRAAEDQLLGRWYGGPRCWDWACVEQELLRDV